MFHLCSLGLGVPVTRDFTCRPTCFHSLVLAVLTGTANSIVWAQ
uniref:Uncharacterized protein n=1 Tax=Arundo donax TaxID=35708 RepID=A0A0A8ZLM6_ARUDO